MLYAEPTEAIITAACEEKSAGKLQQRRERIQGMMKELGVSVSKTGLTFGVGEERIAVGPDLHLLRISPRQADLALTRLVALTEFLGTIVPHRLPFKGVTDRPFTYMIARTELAKPRPQRLYPLGTTITKEEEDGDTRKQDGTPTLVDQRFIRQRQRMLVGVAMLTWNAMVLRHALAHDAAFSPDPTIVQHLASVLTECSKSERYVPGGYTAERSSERYVMGSSVTFEDVIVATYTRWNEQTGEAIPAPPADLLPT